MKTKETNTNGGLLKELLLAGITSNQYLAKILDNVGKLQEEGKSHGGKDGGGQSYLKTAFQGFIQGKVQQKIQKPAAAAAVATPTISKEKRIEELEAKGIENTEVFGKWVNSSKSKHGDGGIATLTKPREKAEQTKPKITAPKITPTPKGAGAAGEAAEGAASAEGLAGALGKAGPVAAIIAATIATVTKGLQKSLDTVFPGEGFVGDNMASYNQSITSGVNAPKDLSSWAVYWPIGGVIKGVF